MADEFVDLYEVIKLPVDADRTLVRKRINELYLEAQANLDHRDFKTRVRYQELFEVTLPQARYILLDEGRRDEYDRILKGIRSGQNLAQAISASSASAPAPKKGFQVEGDNALPGQSHAESLPATNVDLAKLAAERDELWRKWKSGLEDALQREKEVGKTARPRTPQNSAPRIHSDSPSARPSRPAPSPQPAVRPDSQSNLRKREEMEPQMPTEEERQRRMAQQCLLVTEEILQGESMKGAVIGASVVLIPGIILILWGMRKLYPLNGPQMLPQVPESLAWAICLLAIFSICLSTARTFSAEMRRKKAQTLSLLSNEQILKLPR